MAFLDAIGSDFSIENLIAVAKQFVGWIFDTKANNGAVATVLDCVTTNQILWVFLGFSICTIGINLLKRIRSIF